jgi:ligand-binding sensor protein
VDANELFSLLPQEDWAAILREVVSRLAMPATLVDSKGMILARQGEYYELCGLVREKPEVLSFVCGQTGLAMLKEAQTSGKPVVDLCQIGLCKMVVPLFQSGRFLGAVSACGRVPKSESPDPFFISEQLGMSEEEVQGRIQAIPVVDETDVREVARNLYNRLERRWKTVEVG